jgi:TolA-binding protein
LQNAYPESDYAGQAGFERAVIKYRIGDTTSSLAIFEQVAVRYKDSDWGDQSRYRIAMHYRTIGKYDSAIYHFQFIADIDDNPKISSESRYRIGELWMRDKDYTKAIESFLIVKDKFEGYEDWYSQSLLNLGECYENLEQFDSAREIYRVLEIIRPDDDYGKTAKSRLNRIKNK